MNIQKTFTILCGVFFLWSNFIYDNPAVASLPLCGMFGKLPSSQKGKIMKKASKEHTPLRIALIGGTHGNERLGIEIVSHWSHAIPFETPHIIEPMIANQKAVDSGLRFIDYDLNRSFGKNSTPSGYEAERARELTEKISGNFDLVIDLHTTTSHMGFTIILPKTDPLSRRAALYLKTHFPDITIIESLRVDENSLFISALAPSGLLFEIGPVANNIVNTQLLLTLNTILTKLLTWDFGEINVPKSWYYYKIVDYLYYPKEGGPYYIHPEREGKDFVAVKHGDPLFIDLNGKTLVYEGEEFYPFFINEAAYRLSRIAMYTSKKMEGWKE